MENNVNVVSKLSCLASSKKKEVVGVLEFFLSILKKYKEKNPITCFLNVGSWVKIFCFLSSFIGHEQKKSIVEKYDKKSLFPILLKWHYHLHPLAKFERGIS
jgi:hypothetical protein